MLKKLFLLFIKFFKIGAFTFGGGYAMLSLIYTEVVENTRWLSDKEMKNMIIIAESTPGVLAVNTAVFTGYKIAGIFGAVFAMFGVILPSVIIIGIISLFFEAFRELKYVSYAFGGLGAGVVFLIFDAVKKLNKKNKKDAFYWAVLCLSAAAAIFLRINVIYILIASALAGLIYSFVFLKIRGSEKSGG
ncbi:MAG: chromate transporter [Oscillospiraceae bacterium]|nr:chromate transporter [Oscillospiraceae bacterium]